MVTKIMAPCVIINGGK